jgi:hypothetical protein
VNAAGLNPPNMSTNPLSIDDVMGVCIFALDCVLKNDLCFDQKKINLKKDRKGHEVEIDCAVLGTCQYLPHRW